MTFYSAILLAVIQGITEFLPISSSGHLVVVQQLLDLKEAPFIYDLLLHLGTQLAVVAYFWKRIRKLTKRVFVNFKTRKAVKGKTEIIFPLVLVTLPIIVVGYFAAGFIQTTFSSIGYVAFTFIFTSMLLFSTKFLNLSKLKGKWIGLKWWKALIVGAFQVLATLPGVSRSGSTIVGGMCLGLKPSQAFEFSFFAGLIAVTGACIVSVARNIDGYIITWEEVFGTILSGLVGYIAIRVVAKVVKQGKLWYFGFYCLLMSIVAAVVWLV